MLAAPVNKYSYISLGMTENLANPPSQAITAKGGTVPAHNN
ncbi:hypothetical protein [Leptolyngbya sp. FACHB-261]|nr:hypothetical protein [Leptolyngbya sp. FACHB-261]